jgi:hypothetical protein
MQRTIIEMKREYRPERGTTDREAEFFHWWHNGRLAEALDIKVCSVCAHRDMFINMAMWYDGVLCSVCDILRRDRLEFEKRLKEGNK